MDYNARRNECETREYKKFMRVAKRISYLQYGKWTISPDMNDPLRKFILAKDAGWFTVKVSVYMEQFYHRAVWDDSRTDFRGKIQVQGVFGARRETDTGMTFVDLPLNLGMRLKPRMAKKLIAAIDEVIIPKIYQEIHNEDETRMLQAKVNQAFKDNLAKVPDLLITKNNNSYDRAVHAVIKSCPFTFTLEKDTVEVEGRMTYDQLGRMATTMGWGK